MIAHQQSDIYLIFMNSVHQPHSPDVKYLSHNKNMHPNLTIHLARYTFLLREKYTCIYVTHIVLCPTFRQLNISRGIS